MPLTPTLSDIELTQVKFNPGDRVLVRTSTPVTPEMLRGIRVAVNKLARCDLRVIAVNCLTTRILRRRLVDGEEKIETLVDKSDVRINPNPRQINVSIAIQDIRDNDCLMVFLKQAPTLQIFDSTLQMLKEWAGNSVDVEIFGGME